MHAHANGALGYIKRAITGVRSRDRVFLEKEIAGNGNRTRMASLEGWNFTIKLCPRVAGSELQQFLRVNSDW